MAIKMKRSAVAAKVPGVADLALGELAVNTHDGKLYLKRNNGTEEIVDIGKFDFSTQTEAEAGTDNTTVMTPLRARQSVNAITTASATDTTAGRLLKVGDFGIGATSGALVSDIDDDSIPPGLYSFTTPAGNNPFENGSLIVGQSSNNLNFPTQIAVQRNGSDMAFRSKPGASASWTDWVTLGSARGSNGNGKYVRFPDGTQINTHKLTFTYFNGAELRNLWAYPAAMVALDSLSMLPDGLETNLGASGIGIQNTSSYTHGVPDGTRAPLRVYSHAGVSFAAGDTASLFVTAIGRWY